MESNFYSRLALLPEFSPEVFERFASTSVLVIGAGGLGCPVLSGLNSVGFGEISVMDGDRIDASNLSRQYLYTPSDIGLYKSEVAAKVLNSSGSSTRVTFIREHISVENAQSVIGGFDIVVDCTDNFYARYLINDACFIENKVLVYGAVHRYEGSATVFHYKNGPTLRCLYPIFPSANEIKGCNENGILPTVTSMIGSIMANEVIKIIGGFGEVLSGRLLSINMSNLQFDTISFIKSDIINFPTRILDENYQNTACIVPMEQEITVEELEQWRNEGRKHQLIDVRTKREFEFCNLGGINIPLELLEDNLNQISNELPLVFICHHGSRSEKALKVLINHGHQGRTYHLKGGIHSWAVYIDHEMPKY